MFKTAFERTYRAHLQYFMTEYAREFRGVVVELQASTNLFAANNFQKYCLWSD